MKASLVSVLALALVTTAGCGARAFERGPDVAAEPRSGAPLALTTVETDATAPSFPARLTAATTPAAADRLAHRVQTELGGVARADLKLCVDGTGAVTDAKVVRGSGIDALDAAFVDAARAWRYQALAIPSASACQKVQIDYRVR